MYLRLASKEHQKPYRGCKDSLRPLDIHELAQLSITYYYAKTVHRLPERSCNVFIPAEAFIN